MNIFSLVGFFMALGVLVIGLKLSSDEMGIFVDYPSMFIVCGGTLAATAISFQLDRILMLIKIFFDRVIRGRKENYSLVIKELMDLCEAKRSGESLEGLASKTKDEFTKEAFLLYSEGLFDNNYVEELLKNRAENIFFQYSEEANKIKSVSKYAPAFGMMGTTIGMIVLLANLAGEDAMKKIGPAMGVCLITTLYGVVLANLFFGPVAENLQDSAKEKYLKSQIIIKGVGLIVEGVNPVMIMEELNSFLMPADRLKYD